MQPGLFRLKAPHLEPERLHVVNPVENVWQYLHQNWLAQPERITSIGMRDCAHLGQTL
jgi:hypothetical protein